MVLMYSHMGDDEYILVSLNNNELTSKTLYMSQFDSEKGEYIDFKELKEVVPDAFVLESFWFMDVDPIEHYEEVIAEMAQKDIG